MGRLGSLGLWGINLLLRGFERWGPPSTFLVRGIEVTSTPHAIVRLRGIEAECVRRALAHPCQGEARREDFHPECPWLPSRAHLFLRQSSARLFHLISATFMNVTELSFNLLIFKKGS